MKALRSRLFGLVLVGAVAASGWACTAVSTEPESQPPVSTELVRDQLVPVVKGTLKEALRALNGLLECLPLPDDMSQRTIGPSGGTIRTGGYSLVVPPGAVSRWITVRMEQVSGNVNSVRFSPDGLKFAKSARLTMSYSNCRPTPAGGQNRIAYVDEALRILELPESRDSKERKEVTAGIDHFSRYAIAW